MKQAIVLLSGGLDSATVAAIAKSGGFDDWIALSFSYGQKHSAELDAAARVATALKASEHIVFPIALDSFGASSLTQKGVEVPDASATPKLENDIPSTYVPARNIVFLSIALALAESRSCQDIFIGANAVDYSGYPDCRPEFIDSFAKMANIGTKQGALGTRINIHTPIIDMSKAEIVRLGTSLGVDYALTVSCYRANDNGEACGHCDSCYFRKEGFHAAELFDPTLYATEH